MSLPRTWLPVNQLSSITYRARLRLEKVDGQIVSVRVVAHFIVTGKIKAGMTSIAVYFQQAPHSGILRDCGILRVVTPTCKEYIKSPKKHQEPLKATKDRTISAISRFKLSSLDIPYHHRNRYSIMPLVKIDMIKGVRTPDEIKHLADVIQEIMLDKFAAPPRDRYQVCIHAIASCINCISASISHIHH